MAEEIIFSDLLAQAEKSGYTFSALPVGEYDTKVADASVRQTSNQKNKIVVRFQVTSGPYAGRTVFNDFVLTPGNPNAMVIFFRQMSSLGLDGSYFSQNPSLQKVSQDLIGREQRLRLGIRNWQGVDRNSVLQIIPVAGAPAAGVVPQFSAPAPPPPPPLPSQPAPAPASQQSPAYPSAPVPPPLMAPPAEAAQAADGTPPPALPF